MNSLNLYFIIFFGLSCYFGQLIFREKTAVLIEDYFNNIIEDIRGFFKK